MYFMNLLNEKKLITFTLNILSASLIIFHVKKWRSVMLSLQLNIILL